MTNTNSLLLLLLGDSLTKPVVNAEAS